MCALQSQACAFHTIHSASTFAHQCHFFIGLNSAGDLPENVVLASSLESALLAGGDTVDKVFVIGGSELYKEALSSALCATVYVTRVHGTFDCDAFFPDGMAL